MPPDRGYIERSEAVTPGGVHSQRRQSDPPLSFVRAKGAKVWDDAGKEYVDFHAAYGAIILGHADPAVIERVAAGMKLVDLLGFGVTPLEVELSEKLVAAVPCFDQVLLCNSGSEATLHAVRLARAVSGRRRVLKFQGAYHGTHDYLLSNDLSPVISGGRGSNPDPQAGVFPDAFDATLVCRYNDLDSVRAVADAFGDEIAAIVVEPYGHNIGGAAPVPGFLEGLRRTADTLGALLVFDEVITGIRHGLGGYQQIAGVTPDLATLAKALGNGLPIAAIGGRRRYMERFNTRLSGDVLYSGTFNGGGGPVSAALATMETLAEPGAYEHMASLGEKMRVGLTQIFTEMGVRGHASGIGGVFHVVFGSSAIVNQDDVDRADVALYTEFRRQMLQNGILDSPNAQAMRSHVSLSHTEEDVDRALEAAHASLQALAGLAVR
jgi:glutamate-1-semialdehyde 2,1-aminomutase